MKFAYMSLTFSIALLVVGMILILATDVLLPNLEPFMCAEENDTLIRVSTPSRDGDGEEISFYCQDKAGDLTSADGKLGLVILGLFAPLGFSILLVIRTNLAKKRDRPQLSYSSPASLNTTYDSPIEGQRVDLHLHMPNVSREALRHEQRSPFAPDTRQSNLLKGKLSQLDDAYNAGLIDKTEYQRRKDIILDELAGK